MVTGDKKGERVFYILKMGLSKEGPVFLPSPLFFKYLVGGKIGDMHMSFKGLNEKKKKGVVEEGLSYKLFTSVTFSPFKREGSQNKGEIA